MQRQDEDLDLTCALELQHRTCDARNVVIRGGETVKLMNVAGQESVTCTSSDAAFNDGNLIAPCTSHTRNWAFRNDGIATGIFLHHVRGSNKMLVTSDFSPILSSSTDAGSKPHDALLRIEILPGVFTGMVHYDRFVEIYFKRLPSCSSQLTWSLHVATRTFVTVKRMCPCKVRQRNRGTFVYLHAVEFGIDFSDQTVVAFYKTQDGRNRLADLRTGKNAAVINLITETEDFDVRGVTEMQLLRHANNFEKSDSTMRWVGDIFQFQPSQPNRDYNVTISEPKLHNSLFPVNYTLQYPTTDILLRFPGVYTITEDTLKLRRNGKMLFSRSKRYVNVKKRIAPTNIAASASILKHIPLRYVTLIDMMSPGFPSIILSLSSDVNTTEATLTDSVSDNDASSGRREQEMWHYISTQTQRSCREIAPLLSHFVDIQAQYTHLVRILRRDGPCAPGITGYDFLQNPSHGNTAPDTECLLTASTTSNNGRHALLVVKREYRGMDKENLVGMYNYSAQILSPASVPYLFTNTTQNSFCDIVNVLYSPRSSTNKVTPTILWIRRHIYSANPSFQHTQMSHQII